MNHPFDGFGGLKNKIIASQIKEELKNEKNTEHIQDSPRELNGEQKFLLLIYFDFGNEIKKNTQKASLFASLINLKESTIRPMFSDINRYETEKNLSAIIDFLRATKLNSKSREVEDKLNKIKKRR